MKFSSQRSPHCCCSGAPAFKHALKEPHISEEKTYSEVSINVWNLYTHFLLLTLKLLSFRPKVLYWKFLRLGFRWWYYDAKRRNCLRCHVNVQGCRSSSWRWSEGLQWVLPRLLYWLLNLLNCHQIWEFLRPISNRYVVCCCCWKRYWRRAWKRNVSSKLLETCTSCC